MSNGKQGEAIEAFRRYVEVFERLDPQAVTSYYNEPALLISPQGIASLPTSADVEQFFNSVMADLKAQGYARSEFPRLAEYYLSDELALVSGVGVWKKASGEQLRRFGLTYTLRRTHPSWRIVVATIHDENSALSFHDAHTSGLSGL
jgi:ketosteroid isomerase-like protein